VKNPFGLFRRFSASSVIYKSHRQVLTPIDNFQYLLRLPIFDKTKLNRQNIKKTKRFVKKFAQSLEKVAKTVSKPKNAKIYTSKLNLRVQSIT
jgi:hypothetical protein